MNKFLTKCGLGPLALVIMAGLGPFVLMPPTGPEALAAPHEIASHSAQCSVCMLPLHGRSGNSSILGPDPHAFVEATETALHDNLDQ